MVGEAKGAEMIEPITMVPVPTNAPRGVPRASEAASGIDLILARPHQFKMIGDSMRPRYRPGEMIYVDPALAPKLDEDYVFFNEQRHDSQQAHRDVAGDVAHRSPRGDDSRDDHRVAVSEWPTCHGITGRRNA
jgi:hypothetical protein